MKVLFLYNSKTGTAKKYAEKIMSYLKSNNLEIELSSIQEYRNEVLENADYMFFGCWTHGLIFLLQHPEKIWVDFAKSLSDNLKSRIILFKTYKVLTGTMFRKMFNQLNGKYNFSFIELKSRSGSLSKMDKTLIHKLINNAAKSTPRQQKLKYEYLT